MRAVVAAALLLSVPALAQPARPADREALRAQLLNQAREAQSRQDFGACSSYLEAATAIRSNTEVRYSAALCAFLGGRLPEAQRIAAECLHEREGNPQYLRACQQLLSQVDALEHAPPPPRAEPAATPPDRASPPPSPAPTPSGSAPPVAPATPPNSARGVPAGAIVLWAAGGVSFALAGVGLALHGDAVGPCVAQGGVAQCPDAASAARAADAGTWATMTNVTFSLSLAALAGGTVWWLVDRGRGTREQAPSVRALVGPGSLGLAGTF
ncbi:MAG: hypothetical protein U0325_31510 [Polyangiales bacterium]